MRSETRHSKLSHWVRERMKDNRTKPFNGTAGILFRDCSKGMERQVRDFIDDQYLTSNTRTSCENVGGRAFLRLRLDDDLARDLAPDSDTLGISAKMHLDPGNSGRDLKKEILLSLLVSPIATPFPSLEELESAIALRSCIVDAARRTSVAFDTEEAERPAEYFEYHEGNGFCLRPGKSLIEALLKATQPDVSGTRYSFSCYRATEYILLLAIATGLRQRNPYLLENLESLWQRRAIMSNEFHSVFLREFGSLDRPLPLRYFVPGDRLWFRNPDERSADATGYEGSWVFYLGKGLFCNFWKMDQPYTLAQKCLEIYHWRDGAYLDDSGTMRINEDEVDLRVATTLQDNEETTRILQLMTRPRDPRGVYQKGGCMDVSREFPRWVCKETTDIQLPTS